MRDLARRLDHTLLRADATAADIDRTADEALEHGFAGVCVHGGWVERVARRLAGPGPATVAVANFPHGASSSRVTLVEAATAVASGATEIDVVIGIGALKGGEDARVEDELAAVVAACHSSGARVKAILETGLLTDAEVERAARLAVRARADFVKTSTGFAGAGATVEVVARLRAIVGPTVGIKASGGIRTREGALALLAAGADRLGTSASTELVAAATE